MLGPGGRGACHRRTMDMWRHEVWIDRAGLEWSITRALDVVPVAVQEQLLQRSIDPLEPGPPAAPHLRRSHPTNGKANS